MMFLIAVLQILVALVSGYMAWNFTSPKSFLGVLGFLMVWAIFEWIGYTVVSLIGAAILSSNNPK